MNEHWRCPVCPTEFVNGVHVVPKEVFLARTNQHLLEHIVLERQLAERDERIRVLVSAVELFIEHERGHCGDDGHDVVHPCGVMERARAVLAEPAE